MAVDMALFDAFQERARRVIFYSRYFAIKAGSPEITPEHILRGLLKEDPHLFLLLQPEHPNLIKELDQALSEIDTERPYKEMNLPLHPLAKKIVLHSAKEKDRLGHRGVATQHLLLAMLTCQQEKRSWFSTRIDSKAEVVLLKHGITPELVEAKTKEGIITSNAWAADDVVLKLNAQLYALAEILIAKGIFTRSEFVSLLDETAGAISSGGIVMPLLKFLFERGVINTEERERLLSRDDKADPKPSS